MQLFRSLVVATAVASGALAGCAAEGDEQAEADEPAFDGKGDGPLDSAWRPIGTGVAYQQVNTGGAILIAYGGYSARTSDSAAWALELVDQKLASTIGETEKRRRAEEMERSIYSQNPDLVHEAPYINFYLEHLGQNQATAQWSIHDKIAQAVTWARENKVEREKQIIDSYTRAEKEKAQRSTG